MNEQLKGQPELQTMLDRFSKQLNQLNAITSGLQGQITSLKPFIEQSLVESQAPPQDSPSFCYKLTEMQDNLDCELNRLQEAHNALARLI